MIREYLRFCADTEPPASYHLWSFVTCVAAKLGRNVWFPFGGDHIYPTMYTMLVGAPGTRKSTAINRARKILQASGFSRFSFEKTSKQKFLLDWEAECAAYKDTKAGFDELLAKNIVEDSANEIFVCADEMLDFLGPNNLEFLMLFTTLWDGKESYSERLKNSKSTTITKPTCSMLGGLTTTNLQLAMPPEASGSGFLSRVLLVYGEPTRRRVTFPAPPNQADLDKFCKFFQELEVLKGAVTMTPEAMAAIDGIYQDWEPLHDSRLVYYSSRRMTHLLKLCQVVCACNLTLELTFDHVVQANTILSAAEANMHMALGEYGRSKLSDATQRIISALESAGGPLGGQELYKAVSQDIDRYGDLIIILQNLMRADRIVQAGNKFMLKARKLSANGRFIDYAKWLPEVTNEQHTSIPLSLFGDTDSSTGNSEGLDSLIQGL